MATHSEKKLKKLLDLCPGGKPHFCALQIQAGYAVHAGALTAFLRHFTFR